jgi:hypothetical protein
MAAMTATGSNATTRHVRSNDRFRGQERTIYAQIYAVQQIRVNVCVIISVLGTGGAEHCDH